MRSIALTFVSIFFWIDMSSIFVNLHEIYEGFTHWSRIVGRLSNHEFVLFWVDEHIVIY